MLILYFSIIVLFPSLATAFCSFFLCFSSFSSSFRSDYSSGSHQILHLHQLSSPRFTWSLPFSWHSCSPLASPPLLPIFLLFSLPLLSFCFCCLHICLSQSFIIFYQFPLFPYPSLSPFLSLSLIPLLISPSSFDKKTPLWLTTASADLFNLLIQFAYFSVILFSADFFSSQVAFK